MKKNQVKETKTAQDVFAVLHSIEQEAIFTSNLRTKGDFIPIRDAYGIDTPKKTNKGTEADRSYLFKGGFSNRKGFKTEDEALEFANGLIMG